MLSPNGPGSEDRLRPQVIETFLPDSPKGLNSLNSLNSQALIHAQVDGSDYASGPRLGDIPPPLATEAFHGIVGEFVRMVEPNSEADPAALMTQCLVTIGNVLGRGPHITAEADEHHTSLFLGVVGDSSKARKGSSWGHVRRLSEAVDPEWYKSNTANGLSTGEGLINRVRDAKTGDGDEDADPGVTDKRLLVVESELARALKAADRQGNTLSPVLRSAWDGTPLGTMTRADPMTATDSHISLIGHITIEELRIVLGKNDIVNGFANRFIWTYARRSKLLPDGGEPYDSGPLVERIREAIENAKQIGHVKRDDEARAIWHKAYTGLGEAHPGNLGKVTARSEPIVGRLSLIYALLDSSDVIRKEHLLAALAVWKHAEFSAAYIFGGVNTDQTAWRILDALETNTCGLSRTDINSALGRHVRADDIEQVLVYLERQEFARRERVATSGRPRELWFLVRERSEKSEIST